MHLHRIDVGAVQKRFVGCRIISLYGLDQLELAQDRRAFDRPRRIGGDRF